LTAELSPGRENNQSRLGVDQAALVDFVEFYQTGK
jgi:hypothetical protein